jgi:aryl-alcohol dehydrogenase-like predicted oxidoreductase
MDYIRLGKTGLKVSRICLGCMTYGEPATSKLTPGSHFWALNEEQSRPFFRQALDLGINFFDTANVYSRGASEEVLGRFLKANTKRESVVIATKVHGVMRDDDPNGRGLSRKAILFEVDESLRRLGTDYVDLYQIHRWDYNTPIEETLEALHDVVKAGKVRYIGASSMYAWQFTKSLYLADRHGWTRFVTMQDHYNLIYREEEREMMPLCQSEGIGVIPWSPLARGRLARAWQGENTKRFETDQFGKTLYSKTEDSDRKVIDRLGELAEKRGVARATLALAWMLSKPVVTAPIVGASKPNHLADAAAAVSLRLTPEETASLEELYTPHPVLGFN